MSVRLRELAERLVASGPKASHVSASETHEISDGLIVALDGIEAIRMALVYDDREHAFAVIKELQEGAPC